MSELEPVQQNTLIPITSLYEHKRNFRSHPPEQIKKLKASLERWGQVRSIVAQFNTDGTYTIVAGHGLVQAAQELVNTNASYYERFGKMRVDIIPASWSSEQVTGYLVADNTLSNDASDDEELLAQLLSEQQDAGYDLASLGTDDETLRQMLEALGDEYAGGGEEEGDGGDEFDATPQNGPTRTHVGEIWMLGKHRLLVGDSTNASQTVRLMQSTKASISFTSPPYNVAKNSSLPNKDKYLHSDDNMDESDYLSLLLDFTLLALKYSSYVFVNVQSLSGNKTSLIDYLYRLKDYYADTIIWDKCTAEPAMAKNVLNSQFEYVHVFSDKANRAIGTREFRGTLSNVISMNSRQDKHFSDIHKATFPLAFAQYFVEEFSQPNEIVYEPFCGSGTTLIACERANRICYGCEIEPHYADVILRRYETETGQQATLLERIEEVAHA